jgi:hypothetical protein
VLGPVRYENGTKTLLQLYNAIFKNLLYYLFHLILESIMKIIKTFIKIVHTRYIFHITSGKRNGKGLCSPPKVSRVVYVTPKIMKPGIVDTKLCETGQNTPGVVLEGGFAHLVIHVGIQARPTWHPGPPC